MSTFFFLQKLQFRVTATVIHISKMSISYKLLILLTLHRETVSDFGHGKMNPFFLFVSKL